MNTENNVINEINELKEILKNTKNEKSKIIKKSSIKDNNKKTCKICKIEKNKNEFVIDRIVRDKEVRFKTKCLDCYKEISKKYYEEKKQKVLENIKKAKELKRKTFTIKIDFNDLIDLDIQIDKLKQKFNDNSLDFIKKYKSPEVPSANNNLNDNSINDNN
jgi:hypothetical protein